MGLDISALEKFLGEIYDLKRLWINERVLGSGERYFAHGGSCGGLARGGGRHDLENTTHRFGKADLGALPVKAAREIGCGERIPAAVGHAGKFLMRDKQRLMAFAH